jgi:hypothetical protein
MSQTVANIKVEPMKVTIGEDLYQSWKITTIADVAGSLNNQYFVFYEPSGTKHYCWFNINSAGSDPAIASGTAHAVTGVTSATAAALASSISTVVDAVSGFDATVSGNVVTVTHTAVGYAKPVHDGAADTGFTFEVLNYGDSASEVGFTDGDIEVKIEYKDVEVTAHQTGTEVLSHINTGSNISVSLSLKETTVSQLRYALLGRGDSTIPESTGVSATEVFGMGMGRQFYQTRDRARKMVLHPQVLPSSNLSRDLTFWKVLPSVESLTFSGENAFQIPMSFMIYNDFTKHPAISKMCYGDSTQTLLAP